MAIAIKTLELHITYRCNFACANCITLVGPAPYPHDMPTAMVVKFLEDSWANGWKWETISLYGGEPTVHNEFELIVHTLARYKRKCQPDLRLQLISNGTNTNRIHFAEDYGFGPMVSPKTGSNLDHAGNVMPYYRAMESPLDVGRPVVYGCWMSHTCGIAYNYLGYWPCSPAAAAARVFGYKPAAVSVRDLTVEALEECHKQVCGHCGMGQHDHEQRRTISEIISPTWKKKLAEYNG